MVPYITTFSIESLKVSMGLQRQTPQLARKVTKTLVEHSCCSQFKVECISEFVTASQNVCRNHQLHHVWL